MMKLDSFVSMVLVELLQHSNRPKKQIAPKCIEETVKMIERSTDYVMPLISQWQIVLGILLGFITVAFQGEKAIKQALEVTKEAVASEQSAWSKQIKSFNGEFYVAVVVLL